MTALSDGPRKVTNLSLKPLTTLLDPGQILAGCLKPSPELPTEFLHRVGNYVLSQHLALKPGKDLLFDFLPAYQ